MGTDTKAGFFFYLTDVTNTRHTGPSSLWSSWGDPFEETFAPGSNRSGLSLSRLGVTMFRWILPRRTHEVQMIKQFLDTQRYDRLLLGFCWCRVVIGTGWGWCRKRANRGAQLGAQFPEFLSITCCWIFHFEMQENCMKNSKDKAKKRGNQIQYLLCRSRPGELIKFERREPSLFSSSELPARSSTCAEAELRPHTSCLFPGRSTCFLSCHTNTHTHTLQAVAVAKTLTINN